MFRSIKERITNNSFIREHVVKRSKRSSEWPNIRTQHLEKYPECYICGRTRNLHVHHKIPFHIDPSLELEPTNLMTLCAQHHLIFGHLGWWRCTNYNIVIDAERWRQKYINRRKTIIKGG